MSDGTQSIRPSRAASSRIAVTYSPDIAFPAPAPPLPASSSRSKRGAAQAAAANIYSSSTSNTQYKDDSPTSSMEDDDQSDGKLAAGAPSLTNGDSDYDDTASSIIDGKMGETDEHTMDEMEYSYTAKYKDELTDEDDLLASPKPAAKRKAAATPAKAKRTSKAAKKVKVEENGNNGMTAIDYADTEDPEPDVKPKRSAKSKAAKAVKEATAALLNGEDAQEGGNGSEGSDLTDLDAEAAPKPKKARKQRKPREPKPEPVYVIPEVTKLENPGYKGRLGYACLNTILRKKKPAIFCSRTCRIDTIKKNGMDFLKELGRANIIDLKTLIQWNEDNNIRFMRLSSEMFPFAAHGEYGYSLEYADKELKEAGDLANKYGHRITTHPGQFTQLGSPRNVVVDNAIEDLKYHCEMLDRMGIGKDGVMIIHGGGVFGDKPATIERLKRNYVDRVPENVKARLVLENDELGYNVDDLLPICEELNIPMVLDYHHHNIFPTAEKTLEELMPRILATWERKGITPKFHLSEPRLGAVSLMERRAHSDRCKLLPTPLPSHVDLMIEAKDKEQAVFDLHRIYDLQPTIHENLRPPVEVESLRTQGRKSSKKKKVKAEDQEGEEEGEMEVEGEEQDEGMIHMDGAEVLPPPEPTTSRAKKTPAKKAPAKKASASAKDGSAPKTPGPGETADTEATPVKPKRKASARKVKTVENEEGMPMQVNADASEKVIDQVLAEPAEAQAVEEMKSEEVAADIKAI